MTLCVIPWQGASAQTDYNVPVTLSVSNTAIDRFIGTQWASIQHSWTGTFQYGPYTISLSEPTVILSDNLIKIVMGVTYSTEGPSGSFTITPTLTIPPTTITASNIITEYQDLQQQINSKVTDQYVRALIYQLLSPISWIVYQGQILSQSTTLWTTGSYVGWSGTPSLTFTVSNNELNITVTPTVVVEAPSYTWWWDRPSTQQFGIQIYSNDAIQITYLRVFDANGAQILESYQVASSAYDPSNNRYVTTLVASAPNPVANTLTYVEYQVRITRQSAETLWDFTTQPVGNPEPWGSFQTVSSVMVSST
ncbi:MAG: hypothetical protein M1303_10960 [Bacteroidetes bacterium]|nr:hypothetical protein [Bacteroidota bacterium]